MPYIKEEDRKPETLLEFQTPGELNYFISIFLDEYLIKYGVTYTNINTLVGVLECVKLELYRRIAAPYEDKKKEENGEVYTVA